MNLIRKAQIHRQTLRRLERELDVIPLRVTSYIYIQQIIFPLFLEYIFHIYNLTLFFSVIEKLYKNIN